MGQGLAIHNTRDIYAKGLLYRYFLVPFLLLALHMRPMTWRQLALTAAGYAAVNMATIYMFLFRCTCLPTSKCCWTAECASCSFC